MKTLLVALAFSTVAMADDAVRAIMYEFTYIESTGVISHAQVIGGFPSVDACEEAMAKVYGIGSVGLDAGEKMQLQCSGIREQAAEPSVPPKPKTAI
jgi:hypothetical protein